MPDLTPALDRPADLIPVTAARELIPSRKKGKRVDVATLYRWILKGYLRGWEFRPAGAKKRSLFVSRKEVEELLVPVVPGGAESGEQRAESQKPEYLTAREAAAALRQSDAVLDAAGI